MFVTSCDEHGDGCLHTCYYYRANGQEVCLSENCSDNFLYVGLFSDFIAHQRHLATIHLNWSENENSKKLKKNSVTAYAKICLIFTLLQILATFLFYYLKFRNSIETPKEGKTRRNETDM